MFTLDFDSTPASAFLHGFVKGLAAPVSIYHVEHAPPVPSYTPVIYQRTSTCNVMQRNFGIVGGRLSRLTDARQEALTADN